MLLCRVSRPRGGLPSAAAGRRTLSLRTDDGTGAGLDGRNTGKYRRTYEFMVSMLNAASFGPACSGRASLPPATPGLHLHFRAVFCCCLRAAEKAPVQGAGGAVTAECGTRHRVDGRQRVNRPLRALCIGAAASQGSCTRDRRNALAGALSLTVCPRRLPGRGTSTWSRSIPWKRNSSCSGPSWKASSVTWCRFKRRSLVLGGKGSPLPKPYRTM